MKADLTLVPCITVHPSYIAYYSVPIWTPVRPERTLFDPEPTEKVPEHEHLLKSDRKSHGKVSKQARRKIGKAIDYLLFMSQEKKVLERVSGRIVKFKVAFVTLTLPSAQIHDDNEITNTCLNQLLTELKKVYKVKNYVWRAEKQKNGNIHYHLLTDVFIPYYDLRNRWNRCLNKLGYVDRYRVKHHREQPNSTDIHSLRRIKNVKKYVSKYLSKPDQKKLNPTEIISQYPEQSGRLWSCSQSLSKIEGYTAEVDNETDDQLRAICENSKARIHSEYYYTVIYISADELSRFGAPQIFDEFMTYLRSRFSWEPQMKIAA